MRKTPEKERIREEAAARLTKAVKRRVLRKQAREAKADHEVSYDVWKKDFEMRALDGVACQLQIHGRQRRMESRTSTTLR